MLTELSNQHGPFLRTFSSSWLAAGSRYGLQYLSIEGMIRSNYWVVAITAQMQSRRIMTDSRCPGTGIPSCGRRLSARNKARTQAVALTAWPERCLQQVALLPEHGPAHVAT